MSVNTYDPDTHQLIRHDGYTVDSTPTQNSDNPVSSGGVFTALAGKQNKAWTEIQSGVTLTNYYINNETLATFKEKYTELLATIRVYEEAGLSGYKVTISIPTVALDTSVNSFYATKNNEDSTADCLATITISENQNSSLTIRAGCHRGSTDLTRAFKLYAR